MTEWTTPRLDDRFRDVDRQLAALEHDVRVIAPVAGQVAGIEADVDGLQRALGEIRVDLRDLQRESAAAIRRAESAAIEAGRRADTNANDVIRSGRIENLKLIGIVIGAFATIIGIVLTAYLTGKLG